MHRVALLDQINPAANEAFRTNGIEVTPFAKNDNLQASLVGMDALGVRSGPPVTREIIETNAGLLAVGVFGTGVNHIDRDAPITTKLDPTKPRNALVENGVALFNAPGENALAVAEHVMDLMRDLARGTSYHNQEMHAGRWTKGERSGFELNDKTLGIIAAGNVGSLVATHALGAGMKVICYDPFVKLDIPGVQQIDSQDELLGRSDFVTLHYEGKKDKPVIGADELSRMKPGSYLINTARGQAVDNEALYAAIKSGHIAGAGLDVHPDDESFVKGDVFTSIFQGMPNVVMTPHIGGETTEAQVRAANVTSKKMIDFLLHGTTIGALTIPQAELEQREGTTRITYVHRDEPNAERELVDAIGDRGLNIKGNILVTGEEGTPTEGVGYAVRDVTGDPAAIKSLETHDFEHGIRLRVL